VESNIKKAIEIAGSNLLRPHIKTSKISEVVQMMMDAGIMCFKCATIAEAELLGLQKAKDVLLAYQPVAESMLRLRNLMAAYPETRFSCLVDNKKSLKKLAEIFDNSGINVFIDLNTGMNRTGVAPESAKELMAECANYPNVIVIGIHAYDGNIHDIPLNERKRKADEAYIKAIGVKTMAEGLFSRTLALVIGGTPTFSIHAQRHNVQCSPGTFVFWDKGYSMFTDLPFTIAAIVLTRVVSVIDTSLLCLDVGHKAVSSENPLHQRLHFLNENSIELVSHSEEHLVVRVPDTSKHFVGEVWYAVPYHICPTVALYSEVEVIDHGYRTQQWKVIARSRRINF
jgi:D-serine deaminase-like pyridoxal phosphate-dependent protein